MTTVAVVGSGFIGTAVTEQLRGAGHIVRIVHAPRLVATSDRVADLLIQAHSTDLAQLRNDIAGCETVVNAAGMAAATSVDRRALVGANALLPAAIAEISRQVGASRFVHISSAAVQGSAPVLDESPRSIPSSPYNQSKILAEQILTQMDWDGCIMFRPTSVHGPSRAVTRALTKLARSRWAFTAKPGTAPTPQVHVRQVARAVEILANPLARPPRVVLQPSEGFTTASFLTWLSGGHAPKLLAAPVAHFAVRSAFVPARIGPGSMWGHARRLEMLLFGQDQVSGWLIKVDPSLGVRHPAWDDFGKDTGKDQQP